MLEKLPSSRYTSFHTATACNRSSVQQVPSPRSRRSVGTQLTGPYWIVTHHPRAALLSLSQAPQAELVLPFPTLASVSESGLIMGWEVKGKSQACAWPMAALELTPPERQRGCGNGCHTAGSEASPSASGGRERGVRLESSGQPRLGRGARPRQRAAPRSRFSAALPPWVSSPRAPPRPAPPPSRSGRRAPAATGRVAGERARAPPAEPQLKWSEPGRRCPRRGADCPNRLA